MKSRKILYFIIFVILFALFVDIPKLPFSVNLPSVKIGQYQVIKSGLDTNDILDIFPVKLGLDLQGGTQLVLETQMEKIAESDKDVALESAKEVIERRVNLYGVSESLVQTSKVGNSRRILVELPGIKNASDAASMIGKTAQLDFREEPATISAEATSSGLPAVFFYKSTGLTGKDLKKAQVVFGQSSDGGSGSQVSLEFNSEGAKKFAEITKRNINKPLAIFLDNEIVTYPPPIVQQEILGGNAVISGNFTVEEAKQLTVQLNAGALPVPIKIIEQRIIGATLGQESINKSLVAGVIGIITVIIYMALYYGRLGIIADIALIIYALISFAIFKTGLFILPPITLTLAGIAGFILSVGMAVDANILIFERMKEELSWGKSKRQALELGFQRAWTSIRDSNTSTLITASILYFLGTGPVKGFALTLAIGVLVSMFTAIVVTRTFLKLFIK